MFGVASFIGISNPGVGINIPVLPRFQRIAIGRIEKRVRGFQCGDIAEKSFGGRIGLSVGKITVNAAEVWFRRDEAGSEECFHFRRKKKCAAPAKVVKGLFTETVTSCEELLLLGIPNGEREHAIQEGKALVFPSERRQRGALRCRCASGMDNF